MVKKATAKKDDETPKPVKPAKVEPEKPKEPTEAELAQKVFAEKVKKAKKEFVCANPQSEGNSGCGSKEGSETANGEIVCSKCGWTQPMK